MRRPLAFACTIIIILIYIGVCCGILPIKHHINLPEDGSTLTITGRAQDITDKYIVIKTEDLGTYMAYISEIPDDLKLGEELTVKGSLSLFSHAMNPGGFDALNYYTSKGIDARLWDATITSRIGGEYFIRERLRRFRMKLENRFYNICPEKEASILADLLLGDKEGIDEETEEIFKNSGIAHILSISSLHISILGMGLFRLLRKMHMKPVPAAMCAMTVLILYGIMTGMSISAVRAIGMFTIRMLSYPSKRTADPITSLMLIAAVTLIIHPAYAMQVGFLLSYGAALGIYLFLPALTDLLDPPVEKEIFYEPEGLRKHLKKHLTNGLRATKRAFISSFGISLFTMPIQLYFFYKVSVYSVLLNLLILPCMSLLVFAAMVSLIPGLGIVASISCFLLDIFERLCRLSETLPYHTWNPGRPGKAVICMFYILAVIIIIAPKLHNFLEQFTPQKPHRKILASSLTTTLTTALTCLIMLLILNLPLPARNTSAQLYVGQGNCNVTITDAGEVYIFDGGSTSEKNVGRYTILPYLRYNGLSEIDAIFLSHSDADHVNGIQELIDNCSEWGITIQNVYITQQMRADNTTNTNALLTACQTAGISVADIKAGDILKSGTATLTCLHPAADYVPEDPNSGSMVILAEFASDFTLLIPGDVQGSGEDALTETISQALGSRRLDIYITAHHGSSGTTTSEFLDAARPRLAINSAGLHNRYGHPDEETLARFRATETAFLTLYETGAVTFDFSGKDVEITPFIPCD